MARSPNELPGRPVGTVVPTWSEHQTLDDKVARRRAAVAWRLRHPSWWQRLFRRRSVPPPD